MVPRVGAVQIPKLLPRFECTPGPTPRGEAPPTRHHLEDSAHPPLPPRPGGLPGPHTPGALELWPRLKNTDRRTVRDS